MAEKWRLLNDETPQTGAYNMALDQALAESAAERGGVTLRLYRWSPACVSIGEIQASAKFDLTECAKLGYDVVRRLTGGWAHLHTPDELTYCITMPIDHMDGSTLYLGVNHAFANALRTMGLTGVTQNEPGVQFSAAAYKLACFDSSGGGEVLWQGRKMLGSTMESSYGYTILHGSLPLAGDIGGVVDVLTGDANAKAEVQARMATKAATLASALGVGKGDSKLGWASLTGAIGNAIAAEFGAELQAGALTKGENTRTAELIETRYANDEWTRRR